MKEGECMAMTCVTGGKECTGCMSCYDEKEKLPEEQTGLTDEQKKDFFECLDGAKEAVMETYGLDEYDAVSLIAEYVERQ